MIAAEVGHVELACDYLGQAAMMDLGDLEHNTRDGVHIASLAGAWIAAVAGLGGMRGHDGALSFTPLPQSLKRLTFRPPWWWRSLDCHAFERAGCARLRAAMHYSRAATLGGV